MRTDIHDHLFRTKEKRMDQGEVVGVDERARRRFLARCGQPSLGGAVREQTFGHLFGPDAEDGGGSTEDVITRGSWVGAKLENDAPNLAGRNAHSWMSSPHTLEKVLYCAHSRDRDVMAGGDGRRSVGEDTRRVALRAADEGVELVDEEADPGGVARSEVVGDDEAVA
jgi:hypothetical protein